jgi:hypothetical protein
MHEGSEAAISHCFPVLSLDHTVNEGHASSGDKDHTEGCSRPEPPDHDFNLLLYAPTQG